MRQTEVEMSVTLPIVATMGIMTFKGYRAAHRRAGRQAASATTPTHLDEVRAWPCS